MPTLLKEARINVRCHSAEGFPSKEIDDCEWIKTVASKGYLIITSNKAIENTPVERMAVIESRAKVFFLDEGTLKAIHWAAAIIVSKEKIYEIARDNEGPFFVNIVRKSYNMLYKFRVPEIESSADQGNALKAG